MTSKNPEDFKYHFHLLKAVSIFVGLVLIGNLVFWAHNAIKEVKTGPADTGSRIIAQDTMSDEEAQQLVNERAEASRISISISSKPELDADGRLHINMIVPEDNNGLSERIEVVQNGEIVYSSGVIAPGYQIEWTSPCDAHPGTATATIYAVDTDSKDSGNPVAVEIEIVNGGKEANEL